MKQKKISIDQACSGWTRYELSLRREDYNQVRPHSALGNLSPAEFLEKLAQQKLAA
jgi:transposase InsO family protein